MRIAVVGSGISGLSAAWLLSSRHEVVLFDKDRRPGGHSNTLIAECPEGPVPVDTGFIVYNELNYPNLTALFCILVWRRRRATCPLPHRSKPGETAVSNILAPE